jgi:hypothetical protein
MHSVDLAISFLSCSWLDNVEVSLREMKTMIQLHFYSFLSFLFIHVRGPMDANGRMRRLWAWAVRDHSGMSVHVIKYFVS